MSYTHIHLIFSHLPVFGMLFGILLLAYGFIGKNNVVKKISLGVFVLAAFATIPVYLTGEPAEEIVENIAGVSEAIVEQHEDAAFTTLILMEITGVLALLNLIFLARPFAQKFLIVTSISSVIALGLISWTANLGGKIRHTEIGANATQTTNPGKKVEKENDEDEDEDEEEEDDH